MSRLATAFSIALMATAAIATEALAQSVAPAVTLGSLLKAGFQIVSVIDLTNDEQKVLWPNDPAAPSIMLTLQKGTSVASCQLSMEAWINQDPAAFTGKYCRQT